MVTPPQETIVQDYTKKEVCKIVNDGIQSGDVVLPAAEGGTKLYKHDIVISRNNGLPPYTIALISTSNISYDSTDKGISALMPDFSSQSMWGLNISKPFPAATFISIGYIDKTTIDGTSNVLAKTSTTLELTAIASVSDTITEL